jgi:phage terminase large subunit-like protein
MSPEDRYAAETIIRELERRKQRNKIDQFYPTPENRKGYPVHMAFFEAGKSYRQRLALAANRVGKTEGMGGYETVLHLTGLYPDWWPGKRFDKPGEWWIGGDTATTVRDIIQFKLLGNVGDFGTGLIPGHLLVDTTNKRGVPDAVENIYVKHASGGRAVAQMKSYDQGREAWQGTEKQGVWLDEEPPMNIYTEALTRTMTTNGIVLCTFTPMNGMTEVTTSFLDIDKPDSKFVCTATWDDALHLDAATKKEMLEQYPLHERDARSKGIPTIGVGKIYPVDVESMLVNPFDLPKHWVKGYALDVGWNKTAALWGALDRDSDTLYLYSEHYQGMAEPAVHASAIKGRGEMTGYIDPASMGGSQADGEKLIKLYRDEGLTLALADNKGKEAAIFEVYQRMTSGRLKIFKTLGNFQKELPLYHRDDKGTIVKKSDHLMDCLRYLVRAIPVLTYTNEKTGHYNTTQSGVQYRTSRPNRGYANDY